MTFSYDPTKLASGISETSLVVAYYSVSEGQWITLGGVVNTVSHTITVLVKHFTSFAVIEGVTTTTTAATPTTTKPTTPWWLWTILGLVAIAVILGISTRLWRRQIP